MKLNPIILLFSGGFISFSMVGLLFFIKLFLAFILYDTNVELITFNLIITTTLTLLAIPFLILGYQFIKQKKTIEVISFSIIPLATIIYLNFNTIL